MKNYPHQQHPEKDMTILQFIARFVAIILIASAFVLATHKVMEAAQAYHNSHTKENAQNEK